MPRLLWVLTLTFLSLRKPADASPDVCDAGSLRNRAFVFVKPHANRPSTQALVRDRLRSVGMEVLAEGDIDGTTIDQNKLIDQHYYAIASKATILAATDIPVPTEQFLEFFGEPWERVLQENRACNAMEALRRFGCDSAELEAAWRSSPKVVKFGGGFYCGLLNINDQRLYVFNAFFLSMRNKFVAPGCSIHYYVVEWSPDQLSWSTFRKNVLGTTDPAKAPEGSIRRVIFDQYQSLGLPSPPDTGDNGVHASASPFEGLVEQVNWLGKSVEELPFGKALVDSGLSLKTIQEWSIDPRIRLTDGSQGSVFDAVEDMDANPCLAKLVELNALNT